ncbi:AraC family transcriptional regulator [Chryseobacterium nematophagum]|uniref:AraC family transcriptional regulator n=1 Tax=Chryseobacterium nematophagum TaxID=2305228 RepID=A0A3M7TK90_9FLAO|nr:helix-turn-helix domain-containing protein [Chryseobacterium nematophagum]RNA60482.1 AraC family transcriptional regulator [Chryseobacterium nematophagum]RNA63971.1 AraC family transcriptional regulator [Chryseobacterium nematophagum]RNA63995.1 AraC family transcriptional regulator [Chryseobacterium nematophagum]
MKIQEEKIIFEEGVSFKLSFPSFKHHFYWHYHPEIELVYVEAPHGIRHVGRHISDFMGSDLLLIGSNVPHLNFDYGLKTDYYQAVIQIKTDVVDHVVKNVPEFKKIKDLLDRSYLGFSFKGDTKKYVSERIKNMKSEDKLGSFLDLLKVLQILADSDEMESLNREDTRVKLFFHDKVRMGVIYDYVHAHYHTKLSVKDVASIVHLTPAAFCRYFKKQTDITFTHFVNKYRISIAKTFLLQHLTISEVCYKVGFENVSYFSTLFKLITGETPTHFKNRISLP